LEEYLKRNEAGNEEERIPEFAQTQKQETQPNDHTDSHQYGTSHNLKQEEGREKHRCRDNYKKEDEKKDISRWKCVDKPAQNAYTANTQNQP
jgi:hypothetical protein